MIRLGDGEAGRKDQAPRTRWRGQQRGRAAGAERKCWLGRR